MEDIRQAVIEEAKSWIGTPFHFAACCKGAGVACGPFLIASYKPLSDAIQHPLPIVPQFAKDWHLHTAQERFLDVVKQFCKLIDKPQPADVALFRLGAKDRPYSHGAIVIDWPIVIHAHYRSGVETADATRDTVLTSSSEVSFWSPF